jgi:uncharacterized protein (DUF302 family)
MGINRSTGMFFSLAGLLAVALVVPPKTQSNHSTSMAVNRAGDTFGVYVRLVENAPGPFDEVVASLETAVAESGWDLVASFEAAVEEDDCSYRAHVVDLVSEAYAAEVLAHGPRAAFALPLRMLVYQDENGTHVSVVDPRSLNRTIVAETGFETQSAEAFNALRGIVAGPFADHLVDQQYGQMRDKGLISKTMGIMAGGPFDGKIEKITSIKIKGDADLGSIAGELYSGLEAVAGDRKWQTRPVYLIDLAEHNAVLIGITGGPVESRSFHIVGAGSDESRKDFACAGIAYAGAYPFSVLLTRNGDNVDVLMVDSMFRMKMYFEDAGKMKFAANMRMPGSIENEVRDKIEESQY